jgi:deoxyribose-phosphate aldolase
VTLITVETIARMIDHSLLNPVLTDAELESGLELAKKHGTASVCIKPYFVVRAAQVLRGSGVAVGTVVGFPHGGQATAVKLFEAEKAMRDDAGEFDIVVNIGKVLSGDWEYVERDLREVVRACRRGMRRTKVIFENCYLKDEHKIRLCKISEVVGADFVKTSTGFGPSGATDADLRLMRKNVTEKVGVKAAGGIRTFARFVEVMALGVKRVGATATETILKEAALVLGEGLSAGELLIKIKSPIKAPDVEILGS